MSANDQMHANEHEATASKMEVDSWRRSLLVWREASHAELVENTAGLKQCLSNAARLLLDHPALASREEAPAASGQDYPPLPDAVAHSLGLAKYAHSSNIIAAHEFTPDTEHADEWEALHTATQMRAYVDADRAARAAPSEALSSATVAQPAAECQLDTLNDDLIAILGRPNFTCIRLAQALRLCGVEIKTKAEHEQAAVIHFLLTRYLRHGSNWATHSDADLRAMLDQAEAKNKAAMGQPAVTPLETGEGDAR
jgi:hypothetical protein